MINYFTLEQYNKKCNLGLSKKVFDTIGTKILREVENIKFADLKKERGSTCNVSILFNKVTFNFNIILLNKSTDKEFIKNTILDSLTNELLLILDGIPFTANFKFEIFKAVKTTKEK